MAKKAREHGRGSWQDERRYLLKFDAPGTVTTSAGGVTTRVRGEGVLVVRGEHEKTRGLYLDRFGMALTGVQARKAHTGVITVRALSSAGAVTLGRQADTLRIEAACDINYESLDRAQGRATDTGCYYQPATEPCAAVIEGRVRASGARVGGPELELVRIHVSCAAGGFEEVLAVDLELKRTQLSPLPASGVHYRLDKGGEWKPSQDANLDDNICVSTMRRQLIIQPVAFRDSATDAIPTGSTAAAQFGTAQTVWNKACIDLVIRSTVTITNAMLKTSSDVASIRAAYTDSDPNVIEVFFVANALTAQGGGTAGAIGVASCKPVIAEPNGGNPVLVAHELGHVLNLVHPGAGSNSDPGTVMAPTGSAMAPGTQTVTHIMCTSIANPVLQTTTTACCLSHNIPNHYLRDFPTDAGNEPSEPIGAGMNRYAMSNVWNRRSNTPGTPSVTTGPEHQNPVRFNADMTARTNFLFARTEQLVNLPVRNAVVRFFLKHPGSGGGASNLALLGEVPVPAALAVGVPQTVVLPWTVPAGTPNHSCAFAVVRSDAEPEGDQSSLDWWQFESLAYNDNDWAQRNLDVEDVSSSNSGDFNAIESAPFLVYLPPPKQRPAQTLTLEVDARGAKELGALTLEIVGARTLELEPGQVRAVRVPIGDVRERLVVVLHATVPGRLRRGTTMTIGVNPSIGKRTFVGWAVAFRVAPRREVMEQTLDTAAAGLGDLAELSDLPGVHTLFCGVGDRRCRRPYAAADLAESLGGLRGALERTEGELRRLAETRETGAGDAATRLLRALEEYAGGQASADTVLAAYRALCARIMVAAALVGG